MTTLFLYSMSVHYVCLVTLWGNSNDVTASGLTEITWFNDPHRQSQRGNLKQLTRCDDEDDYHNDDDDADYDDDDYDFALISPMMTS